MPTKKRRAPSPSRHEPIKLPNTMTNEELWENYSHWVMKLANNFCRMFHASQIDKWALYGVGFEALKKAAELWTPTGGAGFLHYSKRGIVFAIRREIETKFHTATGKPYDVDKVKHVPQVMHPSSFDAIVQGREDARSGGVNQTMYQNHIQRHKDADRSLLSRSADEVLLLGQNYERLIKAIQSLRPVVLRDVLFWRFGVETCDQEHTLEQIGRKLGRTRERARQIELKAMFLLRRKLGLRPETPRDMVIKENWRQRQLAVRKARMAKAQAKKEVAA